MHAHLAGRVAEVDAHHDQPRRGQFVAPADIRRLFGGEEAHTPAVCVHDAGHGPLPRGRLNDVERDRVAIDAVDDFRAPVHALHRWQVRVAFVHRGAFGLELRDERQDVRQGSIRSDRRGLRQLPKSALERRPHPWVESRIRADRQVGVAESAGEMSIGSRHGRQLLKFSRRGLWP